MTKIFKDGWRIVLDDDNRTVLPTVYPTLTDALRALPDHGGFPHAQACLVYENAQVAEAFRNETAAIMRDNERRWPTDLLSAESRNRLQELTCK